MFLEYVLMTWNSKITEGLQFGFIVSIKKFNVELLFKVVLTLDLFKMAVEPAFQTWGRPKMNISRTLRLTRITIKRIEAKPHDCSNYYFGMSGNSCYRKGDDFRYTYVYVH